ncbi:MAG: ATP synthase F1 subunit gamma [Cellulosilyticaceae bacterium]
MASLKDIKGRIKSIDSTKQITNAMNLVATAKLTKNKEAALKSRTYFRMMQDTIQSIVGSTQNLNMPLLKANGSSKKTYIVLAGDKGLCGGYNANISKLVMRDIKNKDEANLILVGRKAKEQFRSKGYESQKEYLGVSQDPAYAVAKEIADVVIEQFGKGEVGEVYLAYTKFVSTIQHEPEMIRLLPVDINKINDEKQSDAQPKDLLVYEPSPEEVLDYVLPRYLADVIYGGMVEAAASEQGARMSAMDTATENAAEMIDKLNIKYNRARQAAITQELSEIVGGAEALK